MTESQQKLYEQQIHQKFNLYAEKGYVVSYLNVPPKGLKWGILSFTDEYKDKLLSEEAYSRELAHVNFKEVIEQVFNHVVQGVVQQKYNELNPYKGGACDTNLFHLPGMWEVRSNQQLYDTARLILRDPNLWVDIDRCVISYINNNQPLKWDFDPAILPDQLNISIHENKQATGGIAGEKVCGFMAFIDCTFEFLPREQVATIFTKGSNPTIKQVGSSWYLTSETSDQPIKVEVDVNQGQYILWDPMLPYRIIPKNAKMFLLGMPCGFRRVVRTAKGQGPNLQFQYGRSSYTDTSKLWFEDISSSCQSTGNISIQTDTIIEDARGKKDTGISELDDRLRSFSDDTAPTLLPELQFIQGCGDGILDLIYVKTKPYLIENMVIKTNESVKLNMDVWPYVEMGMTKHGNLTNEIWYTDCKISATPYLLMPLSSSECTFSRVKRSRNIFTKKGHKVVFPDKTVLGNRAALLLGIKHYEHNWVSGDSKIDDTRPNPRPRKIRIIDDSPDE